MVWWISIASRAGRPAASVAATHAAAEPPGSADGDRIPRHHHPAVLRRPPLVGERLVPERGAPGARLGPLHARRRPRAGH